MQIELFLDTTFFVYPIVSPITSSAHQLSAYYTHASFSPNTKQKQQQKDKRKDQACYKTYISYFFYVSVQNSQIFFFHYLFTARCHFLVKHFSAPHIVGGQKKAKNQTHYPPFCMGS